MKQKRFLILIAGTVLQVPAIFILIFICTVLTPIVAAQEIIPTLNLAEEPRRAFLGDVLPFYKKMITPVKIAAVGDLMLGSWIVDKIDAEGVDAPFDSTRTWIDSADLAIANLEAPLANHGELFVDKQYTFKVPTHFVKGIVNGGFDVLTLANNHFLDYGCDGLSQSITALDSAGLRHCGAGMNSAEACAPTILEANGIRVAFVGFSMTYPDEFWATSARCGTCHPSDSTLEDIINGCEVNADLTVVSIHWGTEKKTTPNPYQIEMAHHLIDLGADLVLGHHPHVLQGMELYKGKLIAYSLGNYIFGSLSENAHTSMILRVMLDMNGLLIARAVPIHVYNAVVNFQPKVLKGEAKQQVIKELQTLSQTLNGGKNIIDDEGYVLPSKVPAKIIP
jgi:poly-gamma-glutamate capsule biosynthesis protein CapA/YwtB (metallophosphatase superfamily)